MRAVGDMRHDGRVWYLISFRSGRPNSAEVHPNHPTSHSFLVIDLTQASMLDSAWGGLTPTDATVAQRLVPREDTALVMHLGIVPTVQQRHFTVSLRC